MKNENIIKYSSDFETTTEAVSPTKTWVWAWCSCQIGHEENIYYGNSIESFINHCIYLRQSQHYFHNLKFDGTYIIDYLFRMLNFKCLKPKEKPKEKTFSILMNKMGSMYSIKIYFKRENHKKKGRWIKAVIYDSLKILPFSVASIAEAFNLEESKLSIDYDEYRSEHHIMTDHEREYISHDVIIISKALNMIFSQGDTKITAGSNALNNFIETMGNKKNYRKLYPVIPNEINEDIRKAYKGGYVYVNPNYANKDIENGLVFDKNSMYPSHMRYRYMPYGRPNYFEGQYQGKSRFYIQHLQCTFRLKKGCVPTIQLKNNSHFIKTEYIRECNETVNLYLSNLDLELFMKHYDAYDVDYIDGYWFYTNKGVFNEFIDENYKIKCTSTGALRQNSKLRLNSLYGKFAANTDVTGKIAFFETDKKLNEKIVKYKIPTDENNVIERQEREPEYTPLGVAITSYARYDLISIIDKLGGESENSRFIYCDTDSVHIKGLENPTFIPQDNTKLDYWKKESEFIKARFIRSKTYVEEIKTKEGTYLNVKCAGMPKNVKGMVNFDNFKIGFQSGEKLVPKIVVGGMLLCKTTYELKE